MTSTPQAWHGSGAEAMIVYQIEGESQLRELTHGENDCFEEDREVVFSSDVANVTLIIDDVELSRQSGSRPCEWRWKPGFYAGKVIAEVFTDIDDKPIAYQLIVRPDSLKVDQDTFEVMVGELLERRSELLYGNEAARREIGDDGAHASANLLYSRLRQHAAAFLASVDHISRHPLRRLERNREMAPISRARRIDATTISRASRSGMMHALSGGAPSILMRGGREGQIDTPRSESSIDHPANWAVAASIANILRRATHCSSLLEVALAAATREGASPSDLPWPRRIAFLRDVERRSRRLLALDAFKHLSRRETTAHALVTASSNPDYSRAFSSSRKILRAGHDGVPSNDTLWLSPSWEIYERWCFLKIVDSLESAFDGLTMTLVQRGEKVDALTFGGQVQGIEIRAYLQLRFRSGNKPVKAGYGSVSAEFAPDIVVTVQRDTEHAFYIFDAKYRSKKANVLDAIRSAHVYRDALRWYSKPPRLSLLLVPRNDEAAWLNEQSFWTAERVGTCVTGSSHNLLVAVGLIKADWLSE
jgi:hypothetical protein